MSNHILSNRQIVSRLLWKEFRQVRWFALLLVLLGLMAHGYYFFLASESPAFRYPLAHIATLVPILFAIGCGATIFSNEHENRTFLFQRMLPASRRQILGTKIAVAAGGTLVLFLSFWSVNFFYYQLLDVYIDAQDGVALSSLIVLETLLWSLFFSLVEKRPLHAIAWAVLASLATVGGSKVIGAVFGSTSAYEVALVFRVGLILGLATVTWGLARRWYSGEERFMSVPNPTGTVARYIGFFDCDATVWRSLLWLQVRVCFPWMFTILVVAIVLPIYLFYFHWGYIGFLHGKPGLVMIGIPSAAMLGVSAFQGIQQKRHLILQLGISHRQLWVSQLILPILLVLAIGVWTCGFQGTDVYWSWILLAFAFSTGLYCSMKSHSLLLNTSLALAFAILLSIWAIELEPMSDLLAERFFLGPYTFSSLVILLALGLLYSAFSAFKHWLKAEHLNRPKLSFPWSMRLRLAALLVALVAVSVGPFLVIASQIPFVSDQEISELFLEGTQSKELRQRNSTRGRRGRSKSLTSRSPAAVSQPQHTVRFNNLEQAFRDGNSQVVFGVLHEMIDRGVLNEFNVHLALQDLERAVIHWAEMPTTNVTSILKLIELLDQQELDQQFYESVRRERSNKTQSHYGTAGWEPFLFLDIGWLQFRVERIKNYETKQLILWVQYLQQELQDQRPLISIDESKIRTDPTSDSVVWNEVQEKIYSYVTAFSRMARRRNALMIVLAIQAWKKEHGGQLPATLAQLKGRYLKVVPKDPVLAAPFQYHPEGLLLQEVRAGDWRLKTSSSVKFDPRRSQRKTKSAARFNSRRVQTIPSPVQLPCLQASGFDFESINRGIVRKPDDYFPVAFFEKELSETLPGERDE